VSKFVWLFYFLKTKDVVPFVFVVYFPHASPTTHVSLVKNVAVPIPRMNESNDVVVNRWLENTSHHAAVTAAREKQCKHTKSVMNE
jgi:hypothetical protein